MFDSDMELAYTDDAMTFDVEVIIIDPETGQQDSIVVDNLTSAMYFIVENDLKLLREGYDERIPNLTNESLPDFVKEVHETYREQTLHKFMLRLTCEGDLSLLEQWTD